MGAATSVSPLSPPIPVESGAGGVPRELRGIWVMFGGFRVPTCRGVGPPAPSKLPSFCSAFCVAECSVSCVCVCVVHWQSVAPPSCTLRGILYHVSVVFRELSRKNKAEASWPPPLSPRHPLPTHPPTPLLGFFLPFFVFVTLPSSPAHLICSLKVQEDLQLWQTFT